ncbi:unnamed protein product [Orchesella dallaii]|uniref:Uncharacterized protein n=1 Tax=Orchesella dallaii TaxID=48710 RepID=A0ABP1QLR2_9HEXA
MTSTGNGAQGSDQSQSDNMEKVQKQRELTNLCDEVVQIGNSLKTMYSQLKKELLECHQQISHYHKLRMQLVEAMTAGKIKPQYFENYSVVEEAYYRFGPKLAQFDEKLEMGYGRLVEFEGLLPFSNKEGVDWVKATILVNPGYIERELEKSKIKHDAGNEFFQQLKAEWDSVKISLSNDIEDVIELEETLIVVSQ